MATKSSTGSAFVASVSEADLRQAKNECVKRYLMPPQFSFAVVALAASRRVVGPNPVENVVGVGIGDKISGNQMVGQLCVKFYVRKKQLDSELTSEHRLPATVGGIPTDIEEVGRVLALQVSCSPERRRHLTPAPCGVSVGHGKITAGTIGAVVRLSGRSDGGARFILSNNHVLANSNSAQPGDPIFQPGPLDGDGVPEQHRIGTLTRFVEMNFSGGENTVDCAIAEVGAGAVSSDICSIGAIGGAVRPQRNMTVLKHGRTTGLTRGVITDVDADILVDYREAGVAAFVDQVVIRGVPPTTPFSDGGDSGSVIVDGQSRACALLFAGSSTADVTFANPIQRVLRRMRIRLA